MAENILIHVAVRKIMGTVGEMIARMDDTHEARDLLDQLTEHLERLKQKDFPNTYRQAVADFDGPRSYGLDRIGFWPKPEHPKEKKS